jgi:hypothetical protein
MLDGQRARITDFDHRSWGRTDVIMTEIREEPPWRVAAGPGRP